MNNPDLILEVKKLHSAMGKYLFGLCQDSGNRIHPSPLQMEILEVLLRREGEDIFLVDLQEELKISKAALSDSIDKLERKGFLEKIPWDLDGRRNKLVVLENGRRAFLELTKSVSLANQKIQKELTKEEICMFLQVCRKIDDFLEKEGIE